MTCQIAGQLHVAERHEHILRTTLFPPVAGREWRRLGVKSGEKVPDFLVTLPLSTLGRFSESPGTSKLGAI